MYFPDTSAIMCFVNKEVEFENAKKVLDGELRVFYLVLKEIDGIFYSRRMKKNKLLFEINKFNSMFDIERYLMDSSESNNEKTHYSCLYNEICKRMGLTQDSLVSSVDKNKLEETIYQIWSEQDSRYQIAKRKLQYSQSAHIKFDDSAYAGLMAALKKAINPTSFENHDFKILGAGIWYGLTCYRNVTIVAKDNFFRRNKEIVYKTIINREKYVGESQIPFSIKCLTEIN